MFYCRDKIDAFVLPGIEDLNFVEKSCRQINLLISDKYVSLRSVCRVSNLADN